MVPFGSTSRLWRAESNVLGVFPGSRGVTAEGLQALQRFQQLMGFDMHSKPFAAVTDSMLESLHSCTLSALRLGNETEPEMHLSAEAIAR